MLAFISLCSCILFPDVLYSCCADPLASNSERRKYNSGEPGLAMYCVWSYRAALLWISLACMAYFIISEFSPKCLQVVSMIAAIAWCNVTSLQDAGEDTVISKMPLRP